MVAKWRDWAIDRFGLKPIKDNALDRRVAKGKWYFGDGAALTLLLVVLVVTGSLMTLSYSPTPDGAYQSVRHITDRQFLGWFIRALHYWSAGLMVVMLFFHLLRQVLLGGYKFPREGTWLIGVAMFFLVLTMSFTGYVLRWDERAIYGLRVALNMFYNVPLIGEWLVVLVQGGRELGALTLTRIYAVHVVLIPLSLLALVAYHIYLVMLHGTTSSSEQKKPVHTVEEQREIYEEDAQSTEHGEVFYPETVARSGAMAYIVFGIAVALAIFAGPQALYPEANLVERSFPIEEWWFWWYSALLALMPPSLAPVMVVGLPLAVFIILVLMPFLDRSPFRGIRKRPFAVAAVVGCVISLFALSALRRDSPWTGWPQDEPPPVPAGVQLSARTEQGRKLFASYGCNSCHAVAGKGPRVGTDLARLMERYSHDELKSYILQPPEDVAMPSYAGRISDEDLELVAEYVLAAQTFPRE